jgi:hypothetical protein
MCSALQLLSVAASSFYPYVTHNQCMPPRLQVVGAVTLFLLPAPLLMKQAYLIVTGKLD